METFDISKFEPWKSELTALANSCRKLTINWIDDKEWYETVKEKRIELKKIRVDMKKKWKALRDDANKFSKAVIAKEKEYVWIIEPEEQRLEQIEKEHIEQVEIEWRKDQLPVRRAMLWDLAVMSDEEILALSDAKFSWTIICLQRDKLAKEEAEKAENDRLEKEKTERDRLVKEAEERATKKAEEKVEKEKQEQQEQIDELIKDKEQREKDAEAEKRHEARKQAKLKKDEEYNKFLLDNNYNEKTDVIKNDWRVATIYRKVSSFIIE